MKLNNSYLTAFFIALCVSAYPVAQLLYYSNNQIKLSYLLVPLLVTLYFVLKTKFTDVTKEYKNKLLFFGVSMIGGMLTLMLSMTETNITHNLFYSLAVPIAIPISVSIFTFVRMKMFDKGDRWYNGISTVTNIVIAVLMVLTNLVLLCYTARLYIGISVTTIAVIVISLIIFTLSKAHTAYAGLAVLLMYVTVPFVLIKLIPAFEWSILIFNGILLVILMTIGRLLYKSTISADNSNRMVIDWFGVLGVISPLSAVILKTQHLFMVFVFIAFYCIMLSRRRGNIKHIDNIFQTLFLIFLTLAWWTQDIFVLPRIFVTEINMLPVAVTLLFVSTILWRDYKGITKQISFYLSGIMTVILVLEAVLYQQTIDAIVIGAVGLIMVVFGFVSHRKKWFALGTAVLITLLVYETWAFWLSLAWWVYLMAVGVILIALTITNEVSKQKDAGLFKKVKRYFDNWD
ncbi:MAG TPA: hypothetical protein GX401_02915 [Clostridiales bacterium]|nr:hypothetical protein [Clostridiales bacterium]